MPKMNGYVKLLVVQVGTYESKILMEYNLSDKIEAQNKMRKYKSDDSIIGITKKSRVFPTLFYTIIFLLCAIIIYTVKD